jgi:hypothetical protein
MIICCYTIPSGMFPVTLLGSIFEKLYLLKLYKLVIGRGFPKFVDNLAPSLRKDFESIK